MNQKEYDYILYSIEQIKKETHENNIMLKELIKYFNQQTLYANQENMDDFGRNILANIISNMMVFK